MTTMDQLRATAVEAEELLAKIRQPDASREAELIALALRQQELSATFEDKEHAIHMAALVTRSRGPLGEPYRPK